MFSISVVIPVLNRSHLIRRCLDSVANQTRIPDHLIVVDNGSTDDTVEVVRNWVSNHPEINVTLLEESSPGASAARNRGLADVTTDLVYFFDSDDVMLPRLIEKITDEIGDNDLLFWKAEIVGLDGKTRPKAFYADSLTRRHFYNGILSTQVFTARTEFIRRVGGWATGAKVWNDWELGIRISLAKPAWKALPEVLVRIHAQEESITGTRFSKKRGDWERTLDIVESDIRRSDRSITDKRRLLDMLAYRRAVLAAKYRREGREDYARELLQKSLAASGLGRWARLRLRLLYGYTALGGRAAYILWR